MKKNGSTYLFLIFLIFISIGLYITNKFSNLINVPADFVIHDVMQIDTNENDEDNKPIKNISIGENLYKLEIADTNSTRELGLGGRKELLNSDGMIFVFDKPDKYGFWMKDTFLSLDMIWVDENLRIIHIEDAVLPQTFPKVFYPSSNAKYVIELLDGTAKKHGIKIGDTVKFEK